MSTVLPLIKARKFWLKKRLWHRSFPVNLVKFLRTLFLQNTSWGHCFCHYDSRSLLRRTGFVWVNCYHVNCFVYKIFIFWYIFLLKNDFIHLVRVPSTDHTLQAKARKALEQNLWGWFLVSIVSLRRDLPGGQSYSTGSFFKIPYRKKLRRRKFPSGKTIRHLKNISSLFPDENFPFLYLIASIFLNFLLLLIS